MSAEDGRAGRGLSEKSILLWRAVAAAGRTGISSISLHGKFSGVIAAEVISSCLKSLQRSHYLEHAGVTRWGAWRLTPACKVPFGETRPVWLDEKPNDEPADEQMSTTEQKYTRRAEVALPALPASVFNMAKAPPFALDRLQAAPTAAQQQRSVEVRNADREFQRATEQHAILDWKAPLNPEAAEAAEVVETLVGGMAPAATERKREFVCSLDSDGELYIFSEGVELALDLARTRKLLHYLDHLSAIDLVNSLAGTAA